jgi:hypothetical protein
VLQSASQLASRSVPQSVSASVSVWPYAGYVSLFPNRNDALAVSRTVVDPECRYVWLDAAPSRTSTRRGSLRPRQAPIWFD